MNSDQIKKTPSRYRFIKVGDQFPSTHEQENNVFYIGENTQTLQSISETLQVGYSSAVNYQQAASYLRELQKDNIVLNAIMIDLPFERNNLKQFLRMVGQTAYGSLPVIYMATSLTDGEKEELAKTRMVDDIIHPTRDVFTIRERISFLSKIKVSLSAGQKTVTVDNDFSAINDSGIVKRIFDIVLSSLLILALSPIFLFIILMIKLDSSGPVFYNSYRAGRGFRVFKFYKFRTMKVGADRMVTSMSHLNQYNGKESQVFFKVNNDPRVTRIGQFLRNTSLDELPQLFNVLKGDMSMVGNRPLPLYEASSLTTNEWAERFVAPAGITGLWQVKKRGRSDMSVEERIGLDIVYAQKYNMMMDLSIILQTPKVLVQENNV
jgi:lipopolysaccharide/colanic/teichoic acid biosynthesis glycosyltransferase